MWKLNNLRQFVLHLSFYQSNCVFIYLSFYLSICASVYPSINLSVELCQSANSSVYPSISIFKFLPNCQCISIIHLLSCHLDIYVESLSIHLYNFHQSFHLSIHGHCICIDPNIYLFIGEHIFVSIWYSNTVSTYCFTITRCQG